MPEIFPVSVLMSAFVAFTDVSKAIRALWTNFFFNPDALQVITIIANVARRSELTLPHSDRLTSSTNFVHFSLHIFRSRLDLPS